MANYIDVNSNRAKAALLLVPLSGVWMAEVLFDQVVELSGRVSVTIGALVLQGTVAAEASGEFALRSHYRIMGGAAGWRKSLPGRVWHNDALVKISDVISGTAQEAGEAIEGAPTDRIGADYFRKEGPGVRVLSALVPGKWRVDYDGVTRFGDRPQIEVTGDYALLDYDPKQRMATIAVEDVTTIKVGSVLRGRLVRPLVVKTLELHVANMARLNVWGEELP